MSAHDDAAQFLALGGKDGRPIAIAPIPDGAEYIAIHGYVGIVCYINQCGHVFTELFREDQYEVYQESERYVRDENNQDAALLTSDWFGKVPL